MNTEFDLYDNVFTEQKVEEAIITLLDQDGEVFLVAGYFDPNGYYTIRSALQNFIGRNPTNSVTLVVGHTPDQFSATIAHDLWELDTENDQVTLLKYDDRFIHSKHYLRLGDLDAVVIGSANFTGKGLTENLELAAYYDANVVSDKIIDQHKEWFETLIDHSEPVTEEDLEIYEQVKLEVPELQSVELIEELGVSIQHFKEAIRNPGSVAEYRLNLLSHYLMLQDSTKATLAVKSRIKRFPHQIIAGARAYRNLRYNGFYLLADEVGLGKTFEAGFALKQMRYSGEVDRALVLSNTAAMSDWKSALEKFYEDPTLLTPSNKQQLTSQGYSESDIWKKGDLIIATPQMFRQAVEDNETDPSDWDMMILDEAHIVKNDDSQIHEVVRDFEVDYKLFLTATPIQNNEKEFYNLFDALEQNFLASSYSAYKQKGQKAIKDLLKGDRESFMSRNLREDVPYLEIPERDVRDRFVSLTPVERDVYYKFMGFLSDITDRNDHGAPQLVAITFQKIAASSWYALETSLRGLRRRHQEATEMKLADFENSVDDEGQTSLDHDDDSLDIGLDLLDDVIEALTDLQIDSKSDEFIDACTDILKEEDHIVVFTQYKSNILPESKISEAGTGPNLRTTLENSDAIDVPIYTYHGGMSSSERFEVREQFEEKGGIFMTTEAGAESINLQYSSVLFNYDLPWNPARLEQRIGRIQRHGQGSEPLIFNLVLQDTIDRSIYERVIKKHKILQGGFGTSEDVTEQEAMEAVESGSISEIKSTSQLFMEALKERRDPTQVEEYFDQALKERADQIEELSEQMEENLEDFDTRIRALLSGGPVNVEEVEEELDEMSEYYEKALRDYLQILQFVKGIETEINEKVVTLSGDRTLLGDSRIKAALDAETSLFKDIPLLSPEDTPLESLLKETTCDFVTTAVAGQSDYVFDFILTVDSPLNTIETLSRFKIDDEITTVDLSYLKGAQRANTSIQTYQRIVDKLAQAVDRAEEEVSKIESEQEDKLSEYISAKVTRLRRRETEEIQERRKSEIQQPINMQEKQVKQLKETFAEGEASGKELEQAKTRLQELKANRNETRKEIRREIKEKYQGQINEVQAMQDDITTELRLLSAVLPAGDN